VTIIVFAGPIIVKVSVAKLPFVCRSIRTLNFLLQERTAVRHCFKQCVVTRDVDALTVGVFTGIRHFCAVDGNGAQTFGEVVLWAKKPFELMATAEALGGFGLVGDVAFTALVGAEETASSVSQAALALGHCALGTLTLGAGSSHQNGHQQ